MMKQNKRWIGALTCVALLLSLAAYGQIGKETAFAGSAVETAQQQTSALTENKSDVATKVGTKKPAGHVLTVKKGKKKVYFTAKALSKMGTVTYRYSYRNKESKHRQFVTCTGVKLTKVLKKSGLSGTKIRVRGSDGYTKEFSVKALKKKKKAFLKTTGTTAKSVPAIITTKGKGAYRLCFGQSASDTDRSGDYNAQNWVKWIDTIELR